MSAGLAIPAIIILGCALLAGIVAMATRKKRALWDIFPGPVPEAGDAASDEGPVLFDGEAGLSDPDNEPHGVSGKPKLKLVGEATDEVQTDVDTARSDHQSLAEWHQRHNQTVSAWIENHQRVLGDINASGLQIDMDDRDELLAGHDELAPRMRAAIASHPSPVMRAELSAMHVAGEAAVFAVIKSDYASARRQHLVYVQYRDEWIERLRQFSEEPMSNLRAVMSATEFELEEIRTALEIALIGTEEPAEDAPGFEAPIMVQQDSEPAFDLENQPEDALEVAVGVPEDTTEDLEGGRIRRLLRRRSTTEDAG